VRFGRERYRLRILGASVDPENHGSKHVLEKLGIGFVREETVPFGLTARIYELMP